MAFIDIPANDEQVSDQFDREEMTADVDKWLMEETWPNLFDTTPVNHARIVDFMVNDIIDTIHPEEFIYDTTFRNSFKKFVEHKSKK